MKKVIIYSLLFICFYSCKNKDSNNYPIAYNNPIVKPYTHAIEQDVNNPDLYFERAQALDQINADSLAIVDLKKAIELDNKNPKYFQSLGLLYLKSKQPTQAVIAFQKNLDLSPGEVRVRLLLSKAFLENKQIEKAQEQVNYVLAAAADYPDAIYWNSQIKAAQKDTVAAIQLMKKALEMNPSYYLASFRLADFYAAQNNENTVVQYQKTFKMDTLNVAPLFAIGEFYRNKQEWEKAKTAYIESIRRDPDYSATYIEIGKILVMQDSFKKALRQFNIAMLTQPGNGDAFYNKGLCFEKMNLKDSAKAAFNQAIIFNAKFQDSVKMKEK